MTNDVRVSFRIPAELWERICKNADLAGRTRVAEILGRLERGEKIVDPRYPPKPVEPYQPKRLLSNKQKLEARAREEEINLIEALESCVHDGLTIPRVGRFCRRCGVRL